MENLKEPWHTYNNSTIIDTVCQVLVTKERTCSELHTLMPKQIKKNHFTPAKSKKELLGNWGPTR